MHFLAQNNTKEFSFLKEAQGILDNAFYHNVNRVLMMALSSLGIMQQDNSEQVIIDPKLIAKHYIRTWFFLDLLSSIPLDYIFLIFNVGQKEVKFWK